MHLLPLRSVHLCSFSVTSDLDLIVPLHWEDSVKNQVGLHYGVKPCCVFLCVQMKRLKELRGMMMEAEPCVAVTVRKLVMVSLMEIFKDISPTYRIRPLTAAEKSAKVTRRETESRFHEKGVKLRSV